ncbi:MAG: DUF2779 domain-containing protein, partial [Candidatus Thorarchaeota archaeon]
FLANNNQDPRNKILLSLNENLGSAGSIIVFNDSFEKRILRDLVKIFPDELENINRLLERIIDLQKVFKQFSYYSPQQKGSISLKAVLPALVGKSYSDIAIQNGEEASAMFYFCYILKDLIDEDEIRKKLLNYCSLDTYAMVMILNKIRQICKN